MVLLEPLRQRDEVTAQHGAWDHVTAGDEQRDRGQCAWISLLKVRWHSLGRQRELGLAKEAVTVVGVFLCAFV